MSDIVVAKLSAWLGFNFNDKDLLKFKLGIAAASAALIKFTADTMKTTQALTNLNIKTGVSEEFANEMGRLADVAGIGREAIFSAFESISQAQADFKRGEGNISPYTFLGINPMDKKPEEVFKEVLKALDKFGDDVQSKTKALQDLGLDPLLQSLDLRQSPLSKDLLLNKDDIKSLKDLRAEISKFQTNLAILRDKFIALATPIRTFFELGNRIINGLSLLIKNTIGFEKAAKWLSGTLLILASFIFPKFTKIGFILLLIEDFITYLNDGQSVIGYYVKQFKEWWNNLSQWSKMLVQIAGVFMGGLGIMVGISKLKKALPILDSIKNKLVELGKTGKEVGTNLSGSSGGGLKNILKGYARKIGGSAIVQFGLHEIWAKDEDKYLYKITKGVMDKMGIKQGDNWLSHKFEDWGIINKNQSANATKTITQSNNNIINVNSVKEANDMMNELKTQELDNAVMELNI